MWAYLRRNEMERVRDAYKGFDKSFYGDLAKHREEVLEKIHDRHTVWKVPFLPPEVNSNGCQDEFYMKKKKRPK